MRDNVQRALNEDFASGKADNKNTDGAISGNIAVTPVGGHTIRPAIRMNAELIASEAGVLAGTPWFEETLRATESRLKHQGITFNTGIDSPNAQPAYRTHWRYRDGDHFNANDTLCSISGDARILLAAERTAINFIQLLSGTATTTAQFVARAGRVTIRDTRKTIPGLRHAQKYAVRCGGGENHRYGLHDAVLIKDNHIVACGSVSQAVACARAHTDQPIEAEADTPEMAREALTANVECILLDNFTPAALRKIVAEIAGQAGKSVKTEASGNITLENVAEFADTGVDYIAVGALTKHAHAIDMSLHFTQPHSGYENK